jgi:hypothetical protein
MRLLRVQWNPTTLVIGVVRMYIYDKYPPHQKTTESALGELERSLEHEYGPH